MRILVLLALISFGLIDSAQANINPCANAAIGASYSVVMKTMPNQWHLFRIQQPKPGIFEVVLQNSENAYEAFLVATSYDSRTGACSVTGLKQKQ